MKKLFVSVIVAVFLAACSTPTWEGMSEETIAKWKANGLNAGQAQKYTSKGVTAEIYEQWKAVGITTEDIILDWHEEKFSAPKAKAWIDAGFDLDDAVKNSSKGLAPVKAAEATSETEKAEEPAATEKAEEASSETSEEAAAQ